MGVVGIIAGEPDHFDKPMIEKMPIISRCLLSDRIDLREDAPDFCTIR